MINSLKKYLLISLILVLTAGALFAQQRQITIRMASPVPEHTPWGRMFNEMAAEWSRITNGQIRVIIFHSGTAGSEKEVVRKLRSDDIQAAVLSTFGLYEITPEVMTLSCPFMIRNDDELDVVLAGVKGELERRINSKRFYTLAWARIGWVKFFSKQPIFTPADLKRQRLGTNSDQAEMNHVFRTMGFQMVPFEQNQILVALTNNQVDAVFSSLAAVGTDQSFGLARNMASINVAPFLGAIVFNEQTWRRIPEQFRNDMITSTRRLEARLDQEVRSFEKDLIDTLGGFGLVINNLTPQQEQLWYDEIGRITPSLIGTMLDRDIYNRINTLLVDYRSRRR